MKKVMFDIGEEFYLGLIRLRCIAQRDDIRTSCNGCFFASFNDCTEIISLATVQVTLEKTHKMLFLLRFK